MKAAVVALKYDCPKLLHGVFGHFISSEPLSCRTGEELFPGLYEAVVRRRSREGFHAIVTELGVYLAQSHPAAYARWNGQAGFMVASREKFALEPVSAICARMGVRHQRFLETAAELDLLHSDCRKFDRRR